MKRNESCDKHGSKHNLYRWQVCNWVSKRAFKSTLKKRKKKMGRKERK